MSALFLFLALSIAANDPVDDFVSAVEAGDYSKALLLVDGDVGVNSDMQKEAGPTTPAEKMLKFVAQCRVAKQLVKNNGTFTDFWWNCGAEVNEQGVRMRRMAAVDISRSGPKVKLNNFLVARFPDTEKSLQGE